MILFNNRGLKENNRQVKNMSVIFLQVLKEVYGYVESGAVFR